MKLRRVLLAAAVAGLVVVGWVRLGGGGGRPAHAAESRQPEAAATAQPDDSTSDAAWRYRTNQPRHWRYVMLRH